MFTLAQGRSRCSARVNAGEPCGPAATRMVHHSSESSRGGFRDIRPLDVVARSGCVFIHHGVDRDRPLHLQLSVARRPGNRRFVDGYRARYGVGIVPPPARRPQAYRVASYFAAIVRYRPPAASRLLLPFRRHLSQVRRRSGARLTTQRGTRWLNRLRGPPIRHHRTRVPGTSGSWRTTSPSSWGWRRCSPATPIW